MEENLFTVRRGSQNGYETDRGKGHPPAKRDAITSGSFDPTRRQERGLRPRFASPARPEAFGARECVQGVRSQASPVPSRSESAWEGFAIPGQLSRPSTTPSPSLSTQLSAGGTWVWRVGSSLPAAALSPRV